MNSKKQLSFICFVLLLFANIKTIAQKNGSIADTIINKVILFKSLNDTKTYEFTAYNKLIITANPNLIEGRIDSIFVIKHKKKYYMR